MHRICRSTSRGGIARFCTCFDWLSEDKKGDWKRWHVASKFWAQLTQGGAKKPKKCRNIIWKLYIILLVYFPTCYFLNFAHTFLSSWRNLLFIVLDSNLEPESAHRTATRRWWAWPPSCSRAAPPAAAAATAATSARSTPTSTSSSGRWGGGYWWSSCSDSS